jgi:hypothetical protein
MNVLADFPLGSRVLVSREELKVTGYSCDYPFLVVTVVEGGGAYSGIGFREGEAMTNNRCGWKSLSDKKVKNGAFMIPGMKCIPAYNRRILQ